MPTLLRSTATLGLFGLLALNIGCGGNADRNAPDITEEQAELRPGLTDNLQQGQFVDSAVSGVYYRTPTVEGFTEADGRFNYRDGETVAFYIGNLKLGEAKGEAIVTPIHLSYDSTEDIAAMLEAKTGFNVNTVNMLRLLQTLDSDGDPNNGIHISAQIHTAAKLLSPDALDLSAGIEQFAENSTLSTLLGQFTNLSQLTDADNALAHFQDTLDSLVLDTTATLKIEQDPAR